MNKEGFKFFSILILFLITGGIIAYWITHNLSWFGVNMVRISDIFQTWALCLFIFGAIGFAIAINSLK